VATSAATVERLSDTLGDGFVFKKMFGEYALYVGPKVVALVCDDVLFIKPSPADGGFCDECEQAPPYPGAKPYWQVPATRTEDAEWLTAALESTAAALPEPKPKKRRA
jgi:DNA transformation protein and related proteins